VVRSALGTGDAQDTILFDATWGGWDEVRHSRQFSESMERGQISIIETVDHQPGTFCKRSPARSRSVEQPQ
jgi:hypothetical protein